MTFLVWAGVAASAVGWGLKLFVTPLPVPRDVRVADAGAALRVDPSRVLGAEPLPAAAAETVAMADARFQLIGVVAPRTARPVHEGVALIAVDGKPPRAFRVGAAVDGATVLKSVRARGADLGPRDGVVTIALDIPPPAPAATGTLPSAAAPAGMPPRPGGAATVAPQMTPPPTPPMTPPMTMAAPGALPSTVSGVAPAVAPRTPTSQRGVNPFVPPTSAPVAPPPPSPVTTPSQAPPMPMQTPPPTRSGGVGAQIQ
ncbi:MAG: hypothetical protein KGL78_07150 [Burkholderiales bacterium]|nr:hypothetical protein [Burkholderiales bacterium]